MPAPLTPIKVLILRRTVTSDESLLSADGWTLRVKLLVTYSHLTPRHPMGLVKKPYCDWYTRTDLGTITSLAQSLKTAVMAVQGKNTYPLVGTTHSLAGAILDSESWICSSRDIHGTYCTYCSDIWEVLQWGMTRLTTPEFPTPSAL